MPVPTVPGSAKLPKQRNTAIFPAGTQYVKVHNMDLPLPLGDQVEALPQFLTSLAIGLLIGLERERNPSAKAGLRTFTLVSLFGTLTAMLATKSGATWLLAAGMLAVGAMIISVYVHKPVEDNDPGTTTIAALLVCYGLGAMIWYDQPMLAVMLAVVVTILLYFKPELHGMTLRMTRRDVVSILQFSVLTFVVLPILPDQNYGPYGAFNPHQAWLMVVLVSGLSLAGYVALHWTGHRYGAPLLGFLGGLASSTATTLVYARQSKVSADMVKLSAVVILIASQVVMIRLMVMSAAVSAGILPSLIPVLGLALIFGVIATVFDWRRLATSFNLPIPESYNPTEIHAAVGFALLYVAVLLCSAWLSDIAGSKGLYVVSVVGGLTDMDAVTLSSLRLFSLHKLTTQQAVTSIAFANLSNMLFKFGIAIFIGGRGLAKDLVIGFGAMAIGIVLGLMFF
jgi:uncharacterized membrane protein (DUF4010 family)